MKVASENKRITGETRKIESAFKKAGFNDVSAYRYNSVSLRVRVVDSRFHGKSTAQRESMVYPAIIERLPNRTQQDITFLLLAAPEELASKKAILNLEFEDPAPSSL